MTAPPPSSPATKPKATVDNLAFELCEIKVEARKRDLAKVTAGTSLMSSGIILFFLGLLTISQNDFTPIFIGIALFALGRAKQKEGELS